MKKILFDSHAHINEEQFNETREELCREIESSALAYVMDIGYDMESSVRAAADAERWEFCYAAVGCHPHDTSSMNETLLAQIEELAGREKVKAIGEIGLDYHYENTERETQQYWFRRQLQLAKKLKMPIVIHDREANDDVLRILKEEGIFDRERTACFPPQPDGTPDARVLLHCFSGSRELAEQYIKLGATLSIAGPITFKNARRTVEVVLAVDLSRLLVETDSPYLAPEPFRGKPNKPVYVEQTARRIAEIKGISFEEVAEATCQNAKRFFDIEMNAEAAAKPNAGLDKGSGERADTGSEQRPDYKKLQNGSDIRGVALPGEAGEKPNLTAQAAFDLSIGFLLWLSEKTGKQVADLTIAIGRDPRLSGEMLLSAAAEGMLSCGVRLLDCGLASTPAMFMTTVFSEYACDGAIMITASHLPKDRNGFKYFDKDGGLNKGDIAAIISAAEQGRRPSAAAKQGETLTGAECAGRVEKRDLIETYAAFLRGKIIAGVLPSVNDFRNDFLDPAFDPEKPLAGLKIVVDAGNGSGGFYASKVLAPLGADVSASQFLKPDGNFPNHVPNPEDAAAMNSVAKRVKETGADFGLIFDTDVDRSSAIDDKAREINRNGIVALAAALVAEEHPGTTVVTDSITSSQLTEFIEGKLGLHHRRFKRGYKNVINEAIRLNQEGTDCQLAIETSGHAALAENYFLDDGAYLATKIVIKAAKLALCGEKLSGVIAGLSEPAEAVEVRFPIRASEFAAYGDGILQDLQGYVESAGADSGMCLVQPNYEGVRINFDADHGQGWCLLRKSLHDPIMPLNIESDQVGGCRKIAAILKQFLQNYSELDISALF